MNVFNLVALVFVSTWHMSHGSCTDYEIATCARPLVAFNLTNAPIVPTRSEVEMTQLCNAYSEVGKCLARIEHDCDKIQRLKMKAIDHQYDYICDLTFDAYSRHRKCLATSELHTDANTCNDTLIQHYISIKNSTWSSDYKTDRLCQYVNQYISCIYVTVRGYCGEEAAEWQRGLDLVTVGPAFGSLDCEIFHEKKMAPPGPAASTASGTNTTTIIVAVIIVGLACLVLVGAMTAFFIHRKRKADQKRVAHEMLGRNREPREQRRRSTQRSQNGLEYGQDNFAETTEGAEAAPQPAEFLAPPPYLEKDIPPPSYRNPPNYDAIFAGGAGATGVSVDSDDIYHRDKV